MNPTKRKEIIEVTAAEQNVPAEVLDKIVSQYYRRVQKMLSSAEHTSVQLPGLGIFFVNFRSLDRKVLRLRGLIEKLDTSTTMQAYAISKDRKQDLVQLEVLLDNVLMERQRKKMIREIQQAHEQDLTSNLEE